jgi:hypothetical protein
VNQSALVLDRSFIAYMRQFLWGEREYELVGVMGEVVHLLFLRALLRSLFMACRLRNPYQVLGQDRYGSG